MRQSLSVWLWHALYISHLCQQHHIQLRVFCHLDSLRWEKSNRTFPQLLQWCFLRMTVKGALQAMQELQASSGTQSGGSIQSQQETVNTKQACHHQHIFCWRTRGKERADISTKLWVGVVYRFADLRTGPPAPWLPIPMKKWSPDREHSPPAQHYGEPELLDTTEEEIKSTVVTIQYSRNNLIKA